MDEEVRSQDKFEMCLFGLLSPLFSVLCFCMITDKIKLVRLSLPTKNETDHAIHAMHLTHHTLLLAHYYYNSTYVFS